jgi:hypothetical protein
MLQPTDDAGRVRDGRFLNTLSRERERGPAD